MTKSQLLAEGRKAHRLIAGRARALERKGYNVKSIESWKSENIRYNKKMTKAQLLQNIGKERAAYKVERTKIREFERQTKYFAKNVMGLEDISPLEASKIEELFNRLKELEPAMFEDGPSDPWREIIINTIEEGGPETNIDELTAIMNSKIVEYKKEHGIIIDDSDDDFIKV